MSGRFVGRRAELEIVRAVLRKRDVLWITGPAGIGKSRLVAESVARRNSIQVDGYFMPSVVEAGSYLSQLEPRHETAIHSLVYLTSRLSTLRAAYDLLIVEDLHLADRTVANSFLRAFRSSEHGCPVLITAREFWDAADLIGDRLHHLQLWELGQREVEELAAEHHRRAAELPPEAIGHPLLMQIFFRDGPAALEEWTDSLLAGLTHQRQVLMRLALSTTPLQERWALEGCDREKAEALRAKGVLRRPQRLLPAVGESIRQELEESGEQEELERQLLLYLASRPTLRYHDLARALEIAGRYKILDTLAELFAKYAALPSASSVLIQPALVNVLRDRRVPVAVKLTCFRALAEQIALVSPCQLLEVHDDLVSSADPLERSLARVSFLRAIFIAGLRELPPQSESYLEEILECGDTPWIAKEEILHLWAFRAAHAVRDPAALREMVLFLARHGLGAQTLRGYELFFTAVERAHQYRVEEVLATLREAADVFAAAGLFWHVERTKRYLLAFYYVGGRSAEFRELMAEIEVSFPDSFKNELWYRFFTVVDAWNRGEGTLLEEECARLPPLYAPSQLLPRPHLTDYVAWGFRVIRDRASCAPVDPELVEVMLEGLERTVLFAPLVICAVCLAQYLWLAEEKEALCRVCSALAALGPIGAMNSMLIRRFDELRSGAADVVLVDELLERALFLREPLTTPYYAVMAARLIHDRGMPVERFFARVPEVVRAEAAAWVLGTRSAVVEETSGADDAVSALKQTIDDRWFEELGLDDFARAHNISRFVLSRRFKKKLGKSPREYHQEVRISEAKRRLLETAGSITEIAYECGFTDAAQFARIFKEATRMTPSAYRGHVGVS